MIDNVLEFISDHRDWALAIAFVLAMAETLLFVSIFVPSTTILAALGALIATGDLDFTPLFVGGALGATTGSIVSWWLGLAYGPHLLRMGPMRRRRHRVRRTRRTFQRWGAPAVALGHLFGPIRAIVFTMAGLSGMRFGPFFAVTVAGAVSWAFLTPKVGELTTLLIRTLW